MRYDTMLLLKGKGHKFKTHVLKNYMSLAALTSTMLCLKYNQLGAEESDSNYIVF